MENNKFISDLLKRKEKRKAKRMNSLGMFPAYNFYRDLYKSYAAKDKVGRSKFSEIIIHIHTQMAEKLSLGEEIILPLRMGKLEVRKHKSYVRINDKGETVVNKPIDWKSTLDLWKQDAECRNKKVLLRFEVPYIYKIIYNKAHAKYINKAYMDITFSREIKKKLKTNINNGGVEAFMLYN